MVQQEQFYKKIFSWKYLIINGYFDFQNKSVYGIEKASNFYGKDDVIDPESFNLNILNDETIYDLVKSEEYITYKSPYEDGKVITEIKGDNYRSDKKAVRTNASSTTPIVFTIPKSDNVRRKLKFPNLYSYLTVVSVLINNRESIISKLIGDINSTSRFFNVNPYTYRKTKLIKENLLNGYTKFYKADFSSFYHTIYTHSIAWIINSKNITKRYHHQTLLGNLLDKVIELEQNDETHGVPTGSLVTRIIMEYCMAYIDEELRRELGKMENHKISFHRYVDDFTFGYNYDEDLVTIRKALQIIADKYELNINVDKTSNISYVDTNQDSLLLNYFDRFEKEEALSINQLQTILIDYLKLANREEKQNIKGTGKLVFTGINFFINDLFRSKKEKMLKNTLHALTLRGEENEASILDILFEWVLLDSRRGIYLIRLIDRLVSIEKKVNTSVVKRYLFIKLNQKDFFNKVLQSIKFDIQNNYNQEAYIKLLLLKRVGIHLPNKYICLLLSEEKNSDYISIDDFTALLLLSNYLDHLTSNSQNIEMTLQALQNFLDVELGPGLFTNNHWLVRYYVLSLYKYNMDFQQSVDSFYEKHTNYNKVMNYSICNEMSNPEDISSGDKKGQIVDNFFYKLIKQEVKFNYSYMYRSNDI